MPIHARPPKSPPSRRSPAAKPHAVSRSPPAAVKRAMALKPSVLRASLRPQSSNARQTESSESQRNAPEIPSPPPTALPAYLSIPATTQQISQMLNHRPRQPRIALYLRRNRIQRIKKKMRVKLHPQHIQSRFRKLPFKPLAAQFTRNIALVIPIRLPSSRNHPINQQIPQKHPAQCVRQTNSRSPNADQACRPERRAHRHEHINKHRSEHHAENNMRRNPPPELRRRKRQPRIHRNNHKRQQPPGPPQRQSGKHNHLPGPIPKFGNAKINPIEVQSTAANKILPAHFRTFVCRVRSFQSHNRLFGCRTLVFFKGAAFR